MFANLSTISRSSAVDLCPSPPAHPSQGSAFLLHSRHVCNTGNAVPIHAQGHKSQTGRNKSLPMILCMPQSTVIQNRGLCPLDENMHPSSQVSYSKSAFLSFFHIFINYLGISHQEPCTDLLPSPPRPIPVPLNLPLPKKRRKRKKKNSWWSTL